MFLQEKKMKTKVTSNFKSINHNELPIMCIFAYYLLYSICDFVHFGISAYRFSSLRRKHIIHVIRTEEHLYYKGQKKGDKNNDIKI